MLAAVTKTHVSQCVLLVQRKCEYGLDGHSFRDLRTKFRWLLIYNKINYKFSFYYFNTDSFLASLCFLLSVHMYNAGKSYSMDALIVKSWTDTDV